MGATVVSMVKVGLEQSILEHSLISPLDAPTIFWRTMN